MAVSCELPPFGWQATDAGIEHFAHPDRHIDHPGLGLLFKGPWADHRPPSLSAVDSSGTTGHLAAASVEQAQ